MNPEIEVSPTLSKAELFDSIFKAVEELSDSKSEDDFESFISGETSKYSPQTLLGSISDADIEILLNEKLKSAGYRFHFDATDTTFIVPFLLTIWEERGDIEGQLLVAIPEVTKIVKDYLIYKTQPTQGETKMTKSVIDPSLEAAINNLLNQASNGQYTNISDIISTKDSLSEELQDVKKSLASEKMKSKSAPKEYKGSDTSFGAEDLNFEVIYKKACDVFPLAEGKKLNPKTFGFEIPVLKWTDKQGNEVSHPEVPDIDAEYDFKSLHLLMFLTGTLRGMNQWLFGHTGTGKSTFVEQVAAHMGWPVSRINLDSNLERADLVGQVTLSQENGATISKFEEGILPRAMQRPGFLLMDEIDAGRPDILFVVQRALEHKGLMLTEDKGRVIQPHPFFRFVATANTRGQGDEYGMYSGTRTMNQSLIDRFTGFIKFDYMSVDREVGLLMARNPALPQEIAEKMVHFAKEVRIAFDKGEVYNTISPRGLNVMSDMYSTFSTMAGIDESASFQISLEMSLLSKVSNDTRQKYIELASRVMGIQLK